MSALSWLVRTAQEQQRDALRAPLLEAVDRLDPSRRGSVPRALVEWDLSTNDLTRMRAGLALARAAGNAPGDAMARVVGRYRAQGDDALRQEIEALLEAWAEEAGERRARLGTGSGG